MSQRKPPKQNDPVDHHYVPQFLLRNFATDASRQRVGSIGKHGERAVWKERAIKGIGFEKELYVHSRNGVPVSVETEVNRNMETSISQSDTWKKIKGGCSADLDLSDKPVLYALVRHLATRTPHFRKTIDELEAFANFPDSMMEFSIEEREMYAAFKREPGLRETLLNVMVANAEWQVGAYDGSLISVWRTKVPLRCATTPVLSIKAPTDPRLQLDHPGKVPTQQVVAVSPTTAVSLVLGSFGEGFANTEVDDLTAIGLNRQYVGQFAFFNEMRHVICDRDDLEIDMSWAGYHLETETASWATFRRDTSG